MFYSFYYHIYLEQSIYKTTLINQILAHASKISKTVDT